MSRIISRTYEGATAGALIGGAVGTLLTGVVIALPGANIVLAPVVAAATLATVTVSGSAAGTVIGGAAGAISGFAEDAQERKHSRSSQNFSTDQFTGKGGYPSLKSVDFSNSALPMRYIRPSIPVISPRCTTDSY